MKKAVFLFVVFAFSCARTDRTLVLSEYTRGSCATREQGFTWDFAQGCSDCNDLPLVGLIAGAGPEGSAERWQCAMGVARDMHDHLRQKMDPVKGTQSVLVIGGGLHAAIFNRSLDRVTRYRRNLSILTVEAKNALAEHFFSFDYTLNSSVHLTSFFQAPVALDAFVMERFGRYPLAADTWVQTVMSHWLSPSSFMVGRRVQSICQGAKGTYRVAIERMPPVKAKTVVVASGLGSPVYLPTVNAAWLQQQQEQAARCRSLACLPRVMTFDDLLRLNRKLKEKGQNIFATLAGKRVALVGAGDAGNVVLELLYGAAPTFAYRHAGSDIHPRQVVWFGQRDASYAQFVRTAKSRYHTDFFKNLLDRQRVRLSGRSAAVGFTVVPSKIVRMAPAQAGAVRLTEKGGNARTFDFVILATGYHDHLLRLLNPLLNEQQLASQPSSVFQVVLNSDGSPMAYQLVGQGQPHRVYVIGAAALALSSRYRTQGIKPFVTQVDLDASETRNEASFNILAPKTAAFAAYLAGR